MKYTRLFGFYLCCTLALSFVGAASAGERSTPAAPTVWTVTLDTDSPSNPEEGSFRHAIQNANDNDIIRFSDGIGTINLTATLVVYTRLIIEGPASLVQTGIGALLANHSTSRTHINGVTFSGGNDNLLHGNPSGVINFGHMLLTDCTIEGNRGSAYGKGGGVYNTGELEMVRCIVINNATGGSGGGVFSSGSLSMTDCEVEGNSSWYQAGGGIANVEGHLTMLRCTVRNNSIKEWANFLYEEPLYGAGIANIGGAVFLNECTVSGNRGYIGGGIYNGRDTEPREESLLRIRNSTISSNYSVWDGGGITSNSGEVMIDHSTISDNVVDVNTSNAGGIYLENSTAILTNRTIVTGNIPSQIYTYSFSSYTADETCIIGDTAGTASLALAGVAEGASPSPRGITDEADAKSVENDLRNSGSAIFRSVKAHLSADLGGFSGDVSAGLSNMNATLYNAFAYEDVPLSNASGEGELVIEFTASWPENVRYYAAFAEYESETAGAQSVKGYVIPDRGVQFELQPGQPLPDGVTPPDFYENGEGLMTWRNVIADNGPFDHNRETGVVTFRVASVRAEAQTAPTGGSGCSAVGASPFALLPALPLVFLRKKRS
jgi:Synergist-CTERM protein sorting domain-containing protein